MLCPRTPNVRSSDESFSRMVVDWMPWAPALLSQALYFVFVFVNLEPCMEKFVWSVSSWGQNKRESCRFRGGP